MIRTTVGFAGFLVMCLRMQRPAESGPTPLRVFEAAEYKFRRSTILNIRHEIFSELSAWEVTGTDEKGVLWMLDIADDGKILMYEAIGSFPSPEHSSGSP
jgi:hypothetical protein